MAIAYKKADTPNAIEIKAHPLADLFPMMDETAFGELAEDIKQNGLRKPIALLDNQIIDGRNRYKACKAAGVKPKFERYNGDDPLAYVTSLNLKRRHLDGSQRAAVAAKLANLPQGARTDLEPRANLHSASEAAEMLNVSERLVKTAKAVQRDGIPELVEAVEAGKITVSAAAIVAAQPESVQKQVAAETDPKKIKVAVRHIREAKEDDRAQPAETSIADQIHNQRQKRIVSLIIEGLGEREPELLNMLSEGNWDGAFLLKQLIERMKGRQL